MVGTLDGVNPRVFTVDLVGFHERPILERKTSKCGRLGRIQRAARLGLSLAMKDPDEHRGTEAAGELQLLSDDDLASPISSLARRSDVHFLRQ